MFGFGKRKGSEPQKPDRARRSGESKERKSQTLAQLGFLGVGDDGGVDNPTGDFDLGDDDLEEELAMLLEGKQASPRRPKPSPSKMPARTSGGGRKGASAISTDLDINMDNDDVDDDGDVDLDDPELEAELGNILGVPTALGPRADTPMDDDEEDSEGAPAPTMTAEQLISLLQERLTLYEKAKGAADSLGDSAKSRRYARGLKTLQEMLPKAKAGRVIQESDIPPAVSIGMIKRESPSSPSSVPSQPVPPEVPPRPKLRQVDMEESARAQNTAMEAKAVPLDDMISKLPAPLIPTPAFPPLPTPRTQQHTGEAIDGSPKTTSTPVDPEIEARLKEYKRAAVTLKRQGEVQEALKYLKLLKVIETAIANGEDINLGDYPSLISQAPEPPPKPLVPPSTASAEVQGAAANLAPSAEAVPNSGPGPGEDLFGAPPPPTTVMEALEQRLNKYKSEVEKATADSNSSKARRMGRIVKQYDEAIALYKKGKPVPFDELPSPPGFAPIPSAGPPQISLPQNVPQTPTSIPVPAGAESPEKKAKQSESPKPGPSAPTGHSPASNSTVSRSGKPSTKLTLQEKQLQIITLRQQQFKEAALNAKQRGDINQAREFLRTAKGFDKLIQVAQGGLPVDMATLPAPPEAVAKLELEDADNFEVVSASDCIMPSGDSTEVYSKLEDDLKQQLKMCMRTRDHFKSIGDVASANRFESMALESKKDLDALRLAMKKNGDIPKYHYENRIFSITECNTDISEDEIEISILRGINYKVTNPADVDTYIRIELPYPSADEAQSNKTQVVKDTNNPEYNATYKMSINRTARNFQRFVHRHGFKCEVWSKGGFLRGSSQIGTANVKLLPLETKCTLHDAFDVMDGRKVVGKLEVKVRVREPVLTKQITQKKEKWLTIDRA